MNGTSSRKKRPIARALHSFNGQYEHELTFSPGEAILLLKRVDENWLEGELDGKIGIFPTNRVRIEAGSPSLSQESVLARSGKPCAVVLHDFPGSEAGDLPLEEGQMVELLGTVAAGWMRGRLNGGKIGIFPSSFVEIVQPLKVSRHDNGPKPAVHPRPSQRSKPPPISGGQLSIAPVPKPRARTNIPSSPVTETDSGNATTSSETLSQNSISPTSTDVNKTISSLSQNITELSTTLQAEEKILESTQALLQVCQDEEKQMKLTSSLENHKASVETYKKKISQMEVERDDLMSSQEVLSPPATPPSPITTSKQDERSLKRYKTIQELYETEKDYHNELKALVDLVLPSFKKWKFVKYEAIFVNIEQVSELSGRLMNDLGKILKEEENRREGNVVQEDNDVKGVGQVFKDYANDIRTVYGTYCKGQDSASQYLDKLYEDQDKGATAREYFNLGRPQISSWDLHTLLIKPVQRIVKYPLLLDSLLKVTPTDSNDYKILKSAQTTSSQVAQDINEIRRRKDILDRYTGSGRDEKRVNFGTLRKKVRRFNQSIVQRTGLRSATVDAKYDREEAKVFSLESCLRNLQQNVLSWHEEGERLLECREILSSAVSLYMGDNHPVAMDTVETLYNIKEKWNEMSKTLFNDVIGQLSILLDMFRDPLLLMTKRGDKLLDYDSLQHDLEKTTEPDKIEALREQVTLAKRTYEALNTQLLEDLPIFIDRVCEATSLIVTSFIKHQHDLHEQLTSILLPSTTTNGPVISSESTIAWCNSSLHDISSELSKLSVVPTTFGLSFSGLKQTSSEGGRGRESLVKSMSVTDPSSSPPIVRTAGQSRPTAVKERSRRLSMPPKLQHNKEPIYEEIRDEPAPVKQPVISEHEHIDDSDDDDLPPPTQLPPRYDTVPKEPVAIAESLDKLFNNKSHPPLPTHADTRTILYDFTAENEGELSVMEDDKVIVISEVDQSNNSEWCLVELVDGHKRGYVPSNYVT